MLPPFIGRTRERALVRAAWSEVCAGQARLVCLVGEPGIGKTRLATELTEEVRAAGHTTRWGRAWDGPGTPAWWPWMQVLGSQAPAGGDPDTFDALEGWARAVWALEASPHLLVLDDLHAADVATARLLAFVARYAAQRPLLLLATWREADAAARPVLAQALHAAAREGQLVRVEPLDEDDVVAWLRARGEAPTSSQVVQAHRLSGGNPLFLGELASRLAGDGPVPDTVRRAVRDRLALGTPALRDGLEHAAVLGPPLDAASLGALLGMPGTHALLEEGRHLGLLQGNDFRHDLVREALVAGLPPARRAALHSRVAALLIARADASQRALAIAQHLLGGEDPSAAAPWLHQAAAAAFARGTPEVVLELLEQAAPLLGPLGLADLAEARLRTGNIEAGDQACTAALDAARSSNDFEAFSHAALAWGHRVAVGTMEPAHVAVLEEALERVGPRHPGLRVRLLARLAGALQPAMDPSRALSLARAAVGESRTLGQQHLHLQILRTARNAYRPLDPLDERLALDTEALELAERLGDRDAAFDASLGQAMGHLEAGDFAAARAGFADCRQRAGGRTRRELRAALTQALEHSLWGRPEAAQAAADHAERLEALLPTRRGVTVVELHRLFQARWLDPGDLESTLARQPPLPVALTPILGTLHLQAGQPEAAAAIWRRTRHLAPISGLSLIPNAELAAHFGTRDELPGFFALLRPFSGRLTVWGSLAACDGPIDRLLALLAARQGDASTAAHHLALAQDLARRLGSPPVLAQVDAARRALASMCPRDDATGEPTVEGPTRPTLTREGELWRIRFRQTDVRVPDSDGVRYLACLVGRPGEPIHVLDLAREGRRTTGDRLDAPAPGPALDSSAREAYRRRLQALAAQRDDADPLHQAALDREVAFIEAALTGATGLGGRARTAGATAEKARANLTQRIKKTIDRLAPHDSALAHHLRTCIQTGTRCCYDPPPEG